MDRLPLELLTSILLALLPIPPCTLEFRHKYPFRKRINALTRIRLVSKQWNNVVLDTPFLWSYIEVTNPGFETMPLLLERARATVLHIRIDFKLLGPKRLIESQRIVVEMVWSEAYRWETFACQGIAPFPRPLIPSGPLPHLREVAFCGKQRVSPVEIQAPRLETLWEGMDLTNIETSGAPALRSWAVVHPESRREWERFIRVVEHCRQLESLRFILHVRESDEDMRTLTGWNVPEASGGIVFPFLQSLEFVPIPLTIDFLSYIRAPNLRKLIVRGYGISDWPLDIAIPPRLLEACPMLSTVRFHPKIRLCDIQKCLAALPQDFTKRLEVEVKVESPDPSRFSNKDPASPNLKEEREWFERHFPIRWVEPE